MASSDIDVLVDMGFEKERADLGLKHGVQGAIDWLEKNQEKSLDEIKQESSTAAGEEGPPLQPGEEAKSLVCNECGKKFRSHGGAEIHANNTGHTDFSESTDEIAPWTEEEKKERIKDLKAKAAEKYALKEKEEKAAQKRNEEISRKKTHEQQDMIDELQRKEKIKDAQRKRQEKKDDEDAKKRIKAKIAEDQAARKLKQEQERAARTGQLAPTQAAAVTSTPATATGTSASKPASAYTEARLKLQTDQGSIQKTFPVETTLFEVAHAVKEEKGIEVQSFQQNFPRKIFDGTDFGMTLKEAGLVPSVALIVK